MTVGAGHTPPTTPAPATWAAAQRVPRPNRKIESSLPHLIVETDMAADLLNGPEGESVRRQSPLERVARPDEVASTVAFLASGPTDFLTGCIIDINGASYLRT